MGIQLGPKQTILSGASLTNAAGTVTLGQTDAQAGLTVDKGRPVVGTMGALFVVFRVYGASAGNVTFAAPYVSWSGLAAVAANISTVACGVLPLSAGAVAANVIAAAGTWQKYIETVNGVITGAFCLISSPSLHPRIGISADATTLTIEARCVFESDNNNVLINDPSTTAPPFFTW